MFYICALRDGCVIAYWKMESHTHDSTQRQQHPYFSDAARDPLRRSPRLPRACSDLRSDLTCSAPAPRCASSVSL